MKLRTFMLCFVMGLLSAELNAGIVITTSDQQTVESLVCEVTSLSWEGNFKEGNLIVNYSDGSVRQIAIGSVEGISFTADAVDAIDGLKRMKDDDTDVCIYDFQGRLLRQGIKGECLNGLPKGEYIIKSKYVTIKYLKK